MGGKLRNVHVIGKKRRNSFVLFTTSNQYFTSLMHFFSLYFPGSAREPRHYHSRPSLHERDWLQSHWHYCETFLFYFSVRSLNNWWSDCLSIFTRNRTYFAHFVMFINYICITFFFFSQDVQHTMRFINGFGFIPEQMEDVIFFSSCCLNSLPLLNAESGSQRNGEWEI